MNYSVGKQSTADGYHKGLAFGTDSMEPTKGGRAAEESVCIGYNLGTTVGEDAEDYGIMDILTTEGEPYMKDGFEKDGCEYIPVSDKSLNSGTDGDDIYMYCTYDESEKASSPIVSLAMARADSMVETRLWLFAHRYDNTVKKEALFDITDTGRKTQRMDIDIGN